MFIINPFIFAAGEAEPEAVNWSDYDGTGDKAAVEWSASSVRTLSVSPIDATRALIIYESEVTARGRIASVDASGDLSFGTEVVVFSGNPADCVGNILNSTHGIIAVEEGGDVKIIAIEFSGTSIDTVGTPVSIETINSAELAITKMSDNDGFVAYRNVANNRGHIGYFSVSGTTVTAGDVIEFESVASSTDIFMARLTDAKVLLVSAQTGLDDINADLISVSGTTPSIDDSLAVAAGTISTDSIGIGIIDSNNAIIAYSDGTNAKAVVVNEAAGTLTKGTAITTLASTIAKEMSVAMPNSTQAVITMTVNATNVNTTVVDISGTDLTANTNVVNFGGATVDKEYLCNAAMGTDFVIVVYEDDNDSSKGKAIILTH